jgi:probable rRNA maturation factor
VRRPSCARPTTAAAARSAVLEVEVIGEALPDERVREACALAAASAGVDEAHLAVEFVDAARIAELNAAHRGKDGPTDVLSFPVDGRGMAAGPRELGDVVICPEHTEDLIEAVVHGVLHLTGMDHETDDGEMLALQAEIVSWLR